MRWLKRLITPFRISRTRSPRIQKVSTYEPLVLMSGSTIDIYASGDEGFEIMELRIDGEAVATFEDVPTPGDVFSFETEQPVEAGQIQVAFVNDVFDPVNAIDSNLSVDRIVLDGVTFETEDPTVLGTGVYTGTGFEPGFHESEQLAGNGYFQFDAREPDPDPGGEEVAITVVARGDEGDESFRVTSGGRTLADFTASSELEPYTFSTNFFEPGSNLRVEFTNDFWDPDSGRDRNLIVDQILIDGFAYQTEAPGVFSTGTYRPDVGIQPGFPESETLHVDGYFEYRTEASPVDPEPNPPATVAIVAQGQEGTESFRVLSGGVLLEEFTVTTTPATYSFTTDDYVSGSDIRIEFTNDFWDPENGVDANLFVDSVSVNGELNSQAEALYSNGFVDYAFEGNGPDPVSSFALLSDDTVFVSESDGGVVVTAIRVGDLQQAATLEYTLNELSDPNSATAIADFAVPSLEDRENVGLIEFAAGQSEATFEIQIVDDASEESTEVFGVGIQNPSTGSLGVPRTKQIAIVDDDAPSEVEFIAPTLTTSEGDAVVRVGLQRSGALGSSATVQFSITNGTANAGEDFELPNSGLVVFDAGQSTQEIEIAIADDVIAESTEGFTVTIDSVSGAATVGNLASTTVLILDNDTELADLTRTDFVTGLIQPTTLDWTPDGRYLLIAEKAGVVRVIEDGVLRDAPLIEISSQVNSPQTDRGLLGMAVHPDFETSPYVYLLHTYDPPETQGQSGEAGPDRNGNRPSRLARVTVNPETMIADPESLVVLAGTNSTWDFTSRPDINSTGNISILPSGVVNGTSIVADESLIDSGTIDNDPNSAGIQNQNIRDYLATDSTSHSIGDLEFGPDGYLYLSNGDGTSFNFVDPRGVRVQDINNLSGKLLRIDPLTGEGIETNPFFDGDGDSNQSKVFYSGLRNPYRFTFDPVTDLPVIGDVGWNSWEEINTGVPGSNFGWPFLEGPSQSGGYRNLDQAVSFYNNGNRNDPSDDAAVAPILSRSHGSPDSANAITVGDFYDDNTLLFGDVINGTLYAASLNSQREVDDIQVFDTGNQYLVDMKIGPDGQLYGVNLVSGSLHRWESGSSQPDSQTFEGRTYLLTSEQTDWNSAQAEAESLGGNLVSINSQAEQDWLTNTFGTQRMWIGFTDRDNEGSYEWISGDPVSYTNWAPGEPNNAGGQDYAVINWNTNGQWDDQRADQSVLRGIIEI